MRILNLYESEHKKNTQHMVTKITVDFPKRVSFHRSNPDRIYGIKTFEDYHQISDDLKKYKVLDLLIDHFSLFPGEDVVKVIRGYFGDTPITLSKRTRKYRVYHFWRCYIHEQD